MYKKRCEELLQAELQVEDPLTLSKQLAEIESLGYMACRLQAETELKLSSLTKDEAIARAEAMKNATGNIPEKEAYVDGALATITGEISGAETEIRYYKNLSKVIENKISLGQSVLSNISSQIKNNMYVGNIK